MNFKSLLIPAAAALLCSVALTGSAAFGQQAQMRIAVANPSRVFNEMQEFKDLKASLESQRTQLLAQEQERREELQKLQNQRNQLKADTPQWEDLNNKLMDAVGEFQLWGQQTKVKTERSQKRQIKYLFTQIEKAIGEVAARDGYDIVLADQRPELPDNLDAITFEELRARINTRNVLFTASKADISDAVIALLDSKYKAKGGAASGASAAPAPAAPAAGPAPRKPAAPAPAPRQ